VEDTMNVLRFHVPGPPRPKGRHRAAAMKRKDTDGTHREDWFARTYADKKTETEEARIWPYCVRAMHEQRVEKASGAVVLFVLCTFRLPASIGKAERSKRLWHTQTPDKDNLEKIVADSLNGVAWTDDCKVVFGAQAKTWSTDTEGYDVWIAHLPADPQQALQAFRDLRAINEEFLAAFERATFSGRSEADMDTLRFAVVP
jgi:Holliday junction resolvase RusA-like endonuclease